MKRDEIEGGWRKKRQRRRERLKEERTSRDERRWGGGLYTERRLKEWETQPGRSLREDGEESKI